VSSFSKVTDIIYSTECYKSYLFKNHNLLFLGTMSSFNEIINSDTPILVDFHATWCGPCKTMSPILDQVKNQLGTSARILKIDVDKNQTLANKYSVRGVPTLILFKKGEIVWRQSGVVDGKSLIKKIEENI